MNMFGDINRQLRQPHRGILRRGLVATAQHGPIVRIWESGDDGPRSRRRQRRQLRRLARDCKEKTVISEAGKIY